MSVLTKINEVQQQLDFCLNKTQDLGADACEVAIHYGMDTNIDVRLGEVERLESSQDRGLALTIYKNQSKASVSTTDFSKAAIMQLIDKAFSIAKFTEADNCSGIADKALLAFDYPDLDLYHPWNVDSDAMIEKLRAAEAKGLAVDRKITNSEGASFSTGNHLYAYANSHGFIGHYATSSHYFGCSLLAESGTEMQRESEYTLHRVPEQLENFEEISVTAANKAINRLSAKSLPTQQSPIIFSAQMAKGLLGNLLSAISGGSQYTESSFLLNAKDTKIFADTMNIIEDPHLHQGLASSPFDQDGVRTQKRSLIEAGILQGYLLSHYSAQRLNMQTTGNAGGAHNILVQDHGVTFNELIKQMHQGFLVTELMGHGVNLITGDYSRGAVGFWIENGKIAYPVHEVTIAGNLKDIFLGITTVANNIDRRGRIQTGALLVDHMTIAGQA